MANKQDIRKVLGVTAAAFAQMGQVSEEEALAMSGLDAQAFKEVLAKVNKAAAEIKAEPTKKEHFYDIVAKAAAEYMDGIRK